MSTYSGHTTSDGDFDEDDYAVPHVDDVADAWSTPGIIAQTAFDAHFLHASAPSKTSASVFSQLLPPLSPEQYTEGLKKAERRVKDVPNAVKDRFLPAKLDSNLGLWQRTDESEGAALETLFKRYAWELRSGFNLLLYGYGSKRGVVNELANYLVNSTEDGHVLVVNGFNPNWQLRDFVSGLQGVLIGVQGEDEEVADSKTEKLVQTVYKAFSNVPHVDDSDVDSDDEDISTPQPHLYLLIHSLDSSALRAPRFRTMLTALLSAPRVHLCASFDHIAFPLLAPTLNLGRVLWHDATTLAPYTAEMAHADPAALTSVPATSGTAAGATGQRRGPVSESAARHVLASVTVKAKKLFAILGTRQLELMDASTSGTGGTAEQAYDYARLFAAVRDAFVATSDAALRALLGEFKDHGLVVNVATEGAGLGSGEALWIPMRREALVKIIDEIRED